MIDNATDDPVVTAIGAEEARYAAEVAQGKADVATRYAAWTGTTSAKLRAAQARDDATAAAAFARFSARAAQLTRG